MGAELNKGENAGHQKIKTPGPSYLTEEEHTELEGWQFGSLIIYYSMYMITYVTARIVCVVETSGTTIVC